MAGDITAVAEISDAQFLAGLDRMKREVAAYQAHNIRSEAESLHRASALQDQWRATTLKGHSAVSESGLLTSRMLIRGLGAAIAALIAYTVAGRKVAEEYNKELGIGAEQVKRIHEAQREAALSAGRWAQATNWGEQVEDLYRLRVGLMEFGREFSQTVLSGGDVTAAKAYTEEIKRQEAVIRENRAAADVARMQRDQAGRLAGLRDDPVAQARAVAMADYETRARAINEAKGLSTDQRSSLVAGEATIRDEAIKQSMKDQEARRTTTLSEMAKHRRESREAELEAIDARDKERRAEEEKIKHNRDLLELEAQRLTIAGLRAQGLDDEAAKARVLLEHEQRMKDLAESGLSPLAQGEFRKRFEAGRDAELAGIGQTHGGPSLRFSLVEGGNDRILQQSFGPATTDGRSAKEQVTETKKTNAILRSIDRKVGAPSPAVLS